MKSILLLALMLFVFGAAHSQSNYYSSVMDNSQGEYKFLYELPWDSNQLIQIRSEIVQNPYAVTVFRFESISNGISSPYYIPFCADISSEPLFLEDGILATGTTPLNGIECVFFDGSNTIEFDLNTGAESSDPIVVTASDRIFIIGNDGNARQLYEFDKSSHSITKITNSPIDVYTVIGAHGDQIIYQTVLHNQALNQNEYSLISATLTNGIYSYSTIEFIAIPFGVDRIITWGSPVVKWGKLFITQVSFSNTSAVLSDAKIISIDTSNLVEVIHQMPPTPVDHMQQFEWDDALWTYMINSNELYVCRDGVSFAVDIDAGNKLFVNHHISENGKLFMNLYDPISDKREIAAHYGTLETVYEGVHIHMLMEEDNILYLSDWKWYDSSSIVLLHTGFDGIEKIYIDQAEHSPVQNSSLIHNGSFTFLFTYALQNTDVLKLTGSPSASVGELSVELTIYPNPISQGGRFYVESESGGIGKIVSSDGKSIQSFELIPGVNEIETSTLNSGVYILSFENRAHRIVVN